MSEVHQTVTGCSVSGKTGIKCFIMPQSAYEEAMAKYFKPYEFDQSKFNFPPDPETEQSISQTIIHHVDQTIDQQPIAELPTLTTELTQSIDQQIDQIFSQKPELSSTSAILEAITPETTQGGWTWGKETIDSGISSETPSLSSTISSLLENATSSITQQVAGTTTAEGNFIVGQESSTANSTAINATSIDEIFGSNSSITEIIDTTTDDSNVTDVMTYVNHTMRDIGNNTDSSTGDHPHVHSAVVIMCVVIGLLLALIVIGSLVYYFNRSKLACRESKLNSFQQRENGVGQHNETIILADSSQPVQESYGGRL